MRIIAVIGFLTVSAGLVSSTETVDFRFDDPLFRRCISWLLDGNRGALLQNVCIEEFDLPQPSLFLCARKIRTGFTSENDREYCGIVFDEEAKKVRGGYIKG